MPALVTGGGFSRFSRAAETTFNNGPGGAALAAMRRYEARHQTSASHSRSPGLPVHASAPGASISFASPGRIIGFGNARRESGCVAPVTQIRQTACRL